MSPMAAMPAQQQAEGHCVKGTDAGTCLPGKDQGCVSQEDLKDDKAPAPLTFQEVALTAKSPKERLLPRGTCSPGCNLTHLTLGFDSSPLCICAPLTGNREKQTPPHSSHRPDAYLRRSNDRYFSPLTTKGTPAGSNQCFL